MLTTEQQINYIESPYRCPSCGGDRLDSGPINAAEGQPVAEVKCLSEGCGAAWQDLYTLTGIDNFKK
jgi:hypothetical protein